MIKVNGKNIFNYKEVSTSQVGAVKQIVDNMEAYKYTASSNINILYPIDSSYNKAIKPGVTYAFSCYIKCSRNTTWKTAPQIWVNCTMMRFNESSSPTTEWQRFTSTFVGRDVTNLHGQQIHIYPNLIAGDEFCIANIQIEEGNTVTDYASYMQEVGFIKSSSRLPEEYQEVEYIESTGTQYIDTRVKNNGYKSETEIAFTEITGSRQIMGNTQEGFWGINGTGYFESYRVSTKLATINTKYKVLFDLTLDYPNSYRTLKVDNEIVLDNISGPAPSGGIINTLLLISGSYYFYCKAKLYSQKIWNNSEQLVRNFIPCYRKSDDEIGLYDTVNDVFYTNQGTGTFLKGNDITHINIKEIKSTTSNLVYVNKENFVQNGVTFTQIDNNTYELNGTATNTIGAYLSKLSVQEMINHPMSNLTFNQNYTFIYEVLSGTASNLSNITNYALSGKCNNSEQLNKMYMNISEATSPGRYSYVFNNINNLETIDSIYLYIPSGTFTNYRVRFMLVEGSYPNNNLPEYIPYVSTTFMQGYTTEVETINDATLISTNTNINNYRIYGNSTQEKGYVKNVLPLIQETFLDRGITFNVVDNEITVSGTATENYAQINVHDLLANIKPGIYTISIVSQTKPNIRYGVWLYPKDSGTVLARFSTDNVYRTNTLSQTAERYCFFIEDLVPGQTYNDTFKIQLEAGTEATPYEYPYVIPSTDYMSEIKSVGDKTKNVAKVTNCNLNGTSGNSRYVFRIDNGLISSDSITFDSSFDICGGIRTGAWLPTYNNANDYHLTKADGKTYKLSLLNLDRTQAGAGSSIVNVYTNQRAIQSYFSQNMALSGVTSFTLQLNEYVKSIYLWTNSSNASSKFTCNIQLEEGSTETEYEPYGYKIPATISGKNKFNISGQVNENRNGNIGRGNTVSENNLTTSVSLSELPRGQKIYVGAGNTVTISAKLIGYNTTEEPTTTRIGALCLTNYGISGSASVSIYTTNLNTRRSISFTPTTDYVLAAFGVYSENATSLTVTNIQVEIDVSATEYEEYHTPEIKNIYLDEPLRGTTELADYIDFKNKKLIRNFYSEKLTSSQTYGIYKYDTSKQILGINVRLSHIHANKANQKMALCNSFSFLGGLIYSQSQECYWLPDNNTYIYFGINKDKLSDISSSQAIVNSAKALFTQKYNEGNPVEIVYQLATPIEQNINLPTIALWKGTNIVKIDTNTSPSKFYINYNSLNKRNTLGDSQSNELSDNNKTLLKVVD